MKKFLVEMLKKILAFIISGSGRVEKTETKEEVKPEKSAEGKKPVEPAEKSAEEKPTKPEESEKKT